MSRSKKTVPFPTKQAVLEFVRDSDGAVGKREIARAFNIRGDDRARLNALLRELREDGELDRGHGRRFAKAGTLPNVTVIEVTGTDEDGEPVARPVSWDHDAPPPRIFVAPDRRGSAPGIGDRLLSRMTDNGDGTYTGRTIKRLERAETRVLGIYDVVAGKGRVTPTDRRIRSEFVVPAGAETTASKGDLVLIQPRAARAYGLREAEIVEVIGPADGPRAPSLVAIHTHEIPTEFTQGALHEAKNARPVGPAGRVDLRDLPLITIDGADARDFDDAVWAEPDPSADGGWHVIVAIADVSWYVRTGSALDKCAFERGNSVYFPDRVVPMLPEALSNGLCSLVPNEDRGCLAAHLWIDADGNLVRHEFVRGLMRSAARLTYEQVQAARDGNPDETAAPLVEPVLAPLYGAYEALDRARQRRGAIDLELPERKVEVDRKGNVTGISTAVRLDSHKLIEECMIAANVAAAETLERRQAPCMFRIHDQPSAEKIDALAVILGDVGLKLAKGQVMRPEVFRRIVEKAAGTANERLVNEAVLRSQARAEYSPVNIGHFGLALRRYAHFTSPIRRYSDLLVHRALIAVLGLGDDGLRPEDGERFPEHGKHISMTERRAVDAEREAVDRFTTVFLADRVGATFAARINGTHRAGLFITLDETGADGLVPMSLLGDDRFDYDDRTKRVTGRASKQSFALGDAVTVRLVEANVPTGSLLFALEAAAAGRKRTPARPSGRFGGPTAKSRKPAKRSTAGKTRKGRRTKG